MPQNLQQIEDISLLCLKPIEDSSLLCFKTTEDSSLLCLRPTQDRSLLCFKSEDSSQLCLKLEDSSLLSLTPHRDSSLLYLNTGDMSEDSVTNKFDEDQHNTMNTHKNSQEEITNTRTQPQEKKHEQTVKVKKLITLKPPDSKLVTKSKRPRNKRQVPPPKGIADIRNFMLKGKVKLGSSSTTFGGNLNYEGLGSATSKSDATNSIKDPRDLNLTGISFGELN